MANYLNVTGTKQVKSSPGKLYGIFCSNLPSAATITVYDSALSSNADPIIIGSLAMADGYYNFNPGIYFTRGLYVVTSTQTNVSITFVYD